METAVDTSRRDPVHSMYPHPSSPRSLPHPRRSPPSPRRRSGEKERREPFTSPRISEDGNKVSLPPIRDLLTFQAPEPPAYTSAPKPIQPLQQNAWPPATAAEYRPVALAAPLRDSVPKQINPTLHPAQHARRQSYPMLYQHPQHFNISPIRTDIGPPHLLEGYEHRQSFASTNSTSSAGTGASYSTNGTSTTATSPTNLGSGYILTSQSQILPVPPPLSLQRPLPADFPPRLHALRPASPPNAASANVSPTSPLYETFMQRGRSHSQPQIHYISPGSSATFSQDRYVCGICNKAFSRPSSLRIHSHSHTGEKPFRCPQKGCGKAFSVRSNMKRHERGCHVERRSGDPAVPVSAREILPAGG